MNLIFLKSRFLIEYIFLRIFILIISIFPIQIVSNIGGILFNFFGKLSKSHSTAIKNCQYVFPNLSKKEINKIVLKSWQNLGKTIFELCILKKIIKKNNLIITEGTSNIKEILNNKTPAIFFSIHHSNWEICPPLLDRMGMKVGVIYRHINNSLIDNFILKQRTNSFKTKNSFYTPKGKKSAKDIIEGLKNKNSIFLLVDQKDSAGENVSLFNKSIKTQTGFLKIARKYKMPIIPIENRRLENGKFLITFHKPIYHLDSNVSDVNMMLKIHNIIEKWIIKNPTQWFWQHSRFN